VIIVNSNLVPSGVAPKSIFDLTDPARVQGGVGIANPLFGTTATHAAALFAALGPNDAQKYFQALRERKARVVDGNSVVRDMVVKGELAVGLTDTDDAYIALDKGAPVRVVFPDQESLGAFLIPSTVALVRGAPNPTGAQRLIDYLLSREVEAALARSESKQMPVRDGVPPPPGVPRLGELRWMTVHPNDVAKQLPPSSAWLKEEFLR
jgi:iron(III) transport system substrate-binding protein